MHSKGSYSNSRALPAGYPLGGYIIERVLGRGGFGFTYLAKDIETDGSISWVAIKELFPREGVDRDLNYELVATSEAEDDSFEDAKKRFYAEALALKKCQHPNIVKILDYFRHNNTGYIIMEYEDGEELGRYLSSKYREGKAPQELILSILIPLLDGLTHAHKQGVFHRDVKPQNIFLSKEGRPVLLDFGAAKQLNQKHRYEQGQNSQLIVSDGYTPFEQYHYDGSIGSWTDLYALGAVAHHMVTGKAPPPAPSRMQKDSRQPLASHPAVRSLYSAEFLAAVDWAMETEPRRRPQTTPEWRSRLQSSKPVSKIRPSERRLHLEETDLVTNPPELSLDGPGKRGPRRTLSQGQGHVAQSPPPIHASPTRRGTDFGKVAIYVLMAAGFLIALTSLFLLLFY